VSTTCSTSTSTRVGGRIAARRFAQDPPSALAEIGVNHAASTDPETNARAQSQGPRKPRLGAINVSDVNPAVSLGCALTPEFDDVPTLCPNDADSSTREAESISLSAPSLQTATTRDGHDSVNDVIFSDTIARRPTQPTQCCETSRRAPAQPRRRTQVCLHEPRRRACGYYVKHTAFSGPASLRCQRPTH
jgi:hypothetical protein